MEKRVAALATLAMLLAHGAVPALSRLLIHTQPIRQTRPAARRLQPDDAAGTSSARDSGSMAGMPMGTTPPAGAPMGDDDHAAHHPDKAGSMAVLQPAPADGMPAQSSSLDERHADERHTAG